MSNTDVRAQWIAWWSRVPLALRLELLDLGWAADLPAHLTVALRGAPGALEEVTDLVEVSSPSGARSVREHQRPVLAEEFAVWLEEQRGRLSLGARPRG